MAKIFRTNLIALFCIFPMFMIENTGGSGLSLPLNNLSWILISLALLISATQIVKSKEITYNTSTKIILASILLISSNFVFRSELISFNKELLALISIPLLFLSFQQFLINNQKNVLIIFFIISTSQYNSSPA